LSSAILYVAIVAIWAGVLIPRWLRRDSAGSQRASEDLTRADAETSASDEVAAEPAPPLRRRDDTAGSARPARPQERATARVPARAEAPVPARDPVPARAEARAAAEVRAPAPEPAEVPDGEPGHREHTKVLTARRRLLYMLLVLAIGSGALAVTKMAAWWVVVPPTVMLLGYTGMLREASRADAERRELARTHAAAAAAVAAAKRAAPPVPAAPVPGPDAEVIDISASLSVAGHKFYDQYADAKQRAVGDLASLTG
jgi:hypothetical protein